LPGRPVWRELISARLAHSLAGRTLRHRQIWIAAIALLLGVDPGLAMAQPAESILAGQARPGQRVTVTTTNGARLTGKILTDGDGRLVLASNGDERQIVHADIDRVTRPSNKILFGPLIGLGASLALGLPIARRIENERGDGAADEGLAWLIAVGVGMGTLVDLNTHSDKTIYQRRTPSAGLHFNATAKGGGVRWTVRWGN
jgi:hypothetical protein